MQSPRLSEFDNKTYQPGRPLWVQALWFFAGAPLLSWKLLPSSGFRCALLRLFGARMGHGVVIKPGARVKYPWRLTVGTSCWLGEDCWIDNIANVSVGDNVCLSQGAYLCTGNHDWSDPRFRLIATPIVVHDGAWVGAKAVLAPGVVVNECAVVTIGSVVVRDVPAYEIHSGNPARFLRRRQLAPDANNSIDHRELLASEVK